MDAAAYAIIGTAVGGAISGIVTIIGAGIQAITRKSELQQQERKEKQAYAAERHSEKCLKYAEFMSAFWQEERFISEMLEHLSSQRQGWSKAINRINTSPEHRKALESLNDALGWVSIICEEEAVEECALSLSTQFDKMMENFARILEDARDGQTCDTVSIVEDLEALRLEARKLSSKMRVDARIISEPNIYLKRAIPSINGTR